MSVHLKEETLMEEAEGAGSAASREHAATCASCAPRLARAREVLATLRRTDVPEPPAVYWESFRRSVNRRIAEQRPARSWRGWLAPLAALSATAAVAIVVAQHPSTRHDPTPRATASASAPLAPWAALPPADEDESIDVLEGLAVSGFDAAESYDGRGLGPYLAGLTAEETAAVPGALRVEGGAL